MPPNSSGESKPLLNLSMRRGGPPGAGSTTPLALQRSEFEDFMNAYRPTLEVPRREPEFYKPPEEPKADFGRSIKKLMKRPQSSPNTQNRNHRKEGIQRTPTAIPGQSSHTERERSVASDIRPVTDKKPKRPLSAHTDTTLLPSQQTLGHGPTISLPLEANLSKPDVPAPPTPVIVIPPIVKNAKTTNKVTKNGADENFKVVSESATALSTIPIVVSTPIPSQTKKKVSIQEDKRRSGTESFSDVHCLIISGNNIGRFLPPRHNPDPVLSLRVIPIPERKFHVIMEFEECPEPPKPQTSSSGMMVLGPEVNSRGTTRDQMNFFSWIRDSHVASMGLLLANVEQITEFPYVTYLVISGGRQELSQKLNFFADRPTPERKQQLHFLAGYEETITISRPPLATFPEKPSSDKTGFVVCLYQVLPGEDGTKFEQNWVMWTGARQLYRTVPQYMGLKRISVHKSILPSKIINYCLFCEFTNMMEHLTDACVIIDHLRARCCGFIGIYRVLDTL